MAKFEVRKIGGGYVAVRKGSPYYGADEHSVFPTRREAERHARHREQTEGEPQHDRALHEALHTTPGRRTPEQQRLIDRSR